MNILFLKKRPTDYNPNYFLDCNSPDCSKTISAKSVCPLGKPNSSNVIDLDFLLVKKQK